MNTNESLLPSEASATTREEHHEKSTTTEIENKENPSPSVVPTEGRSSPSGKETTDPFPEKDFLTTNWDAIKPSHQEIFQDEGGGDGLAIVNSDEDTDATLVTKPQRNRPTCLRQLLEDPDGSLVLQRFFKDEVHFTAMINFWYACNGLRREENAMQIPEMAKIIWTSFIRNKSVKVNSDTYNDISQAFAAKVFNKNVFDRAQMEVEQKMNETLYPSFLESFECISWLLSNKANPENSPPSPIYGATSESCPGLTMLPTLDENSEFHQEIPQSRLTSSNLLHTANYRVSSTDLEKSYAEGFYLKPHIQNYSSYHCHPAGHAVSLQESEIQSMSSGAHTDEARSYSSSSRSHSFGNGPRRYNKKHFHKLREEARQNPVESRQVVEALANTYVIPRTMKMNARHSSVSGVDPMELTQQLKALQQKQESEEKFKQSLCKIARESENTEEAKKEHAVYALPPNELVNRLVEKTIPVEDLDPSQSILDDHVARVWDSPDLPGTPKQISRTPPIRTPKFPMRQFPDFGGPSSSAQSSRMPYKPLRYAGIHPALARFASVLPKKELSPESPHPYASTSDVGPSQACPRNRRRERDLYSTFSSDSGNVADYHEVDHISRSHHMPKSKSMPEYMQQKLGASSDSGIPRGNRYNSGARRSTRQQPAELTDSGVSVVSDTPSGRPCPDKLTSWLFNSMHESSDSSQSAFSQRRYRESRSMRTLPTPTSPPQPRPGATSSRLSQYSGSMSDTSCTNMRPSGRDETQRYLNNIKLDFARQLLAGDNPNSHSDKRKSRCGNFSKSYSTSSVVGDSSSNGSTLKRQQKTSKNEFPGQLPTPNAGPCRIPRTAADNPSSPQPPKHIQIIYLFPEEVPYVIKVPTQTITLKKYKYHLPKKGNFRYYFKKKCEDIGDIDVVYEEISDDSEVLPLFEGKIYSQICKND